MTERDNLQEEHRPIIYRFRDGKLWVYGHAGIAQLQDQIAGLDLPEDIKEQVHGFTEKCNNITNSIFSEGAIITHKGEILDFGKESIEKYPGVVEIFKNKPGFTANKSEAISIGYDTPKVRSIKTVLRIHFIAPKAKDSVERQVNSLYLPAPITPYNRLGGYWLTPVMEAISKPLEVVRSQLEVPPVVPALTVVEQSVFDMAVANQRRLPQTPSQTI
jgi:hypothetical protein